jgi:hypothetical protein
MKLYVIGEKPGIWNEIVRYRRNREIKLNSALSEKTEKWNETLCYRRKQRNEMKLCVIGDTNEIKLCVIGKTEKWNEALRYRRKKRKEMKLCVVGDQESDNWTTKRLINDTRISGFCNIFEIFTTNFVLSRHFRKMLITDYNKNITQRPFLIRL